MLPPVIVVADGSGDCDSKALLAVVLLRQLGVDAVVLLGSAVVVGTVVALVRSERLSCATSSLSSTSLHEEERMANFFRYCIHCDEACGFFSTYVSKGRGGEGLPWPTR